VISPGTSREVQSSKNRLVRPTILLFWPFEDEVEGVSVSGLDTYGVEPFLVKRRTQEGNPLSDPCGGCSSES
jgi:hypothetical protein